MRVIFLSDKGLTQVDLVYIFITLGLGMYIVAIPENLYQMIYLETHKDVK